jgi:hypothetical protein
MGNWKGLLIMKQIDILILTLLVVSPLLIGVINATCMVFFKFSFL